MRNIFIAFTPYHILLSCGIAVIQGNPANNFLVTISDFSDIEPLACSLKSMNDSPFAQIECLPGLFGQKSMLRRHLTVRKNIKMIIHAIKRGSVGSVHVFHDGRAEAQAALHFAKKNNKDTVGIYVEDGAGAYSSYKSTKRTRPKLLFGKLFYGLWWEDISILGTSSWIDEVKAIFPQLVRPELRSKPISAIPRDALLELRNQKWTLKYIEAIAGDIAKLKCINAILVVAHSEFASQFPGYRQAVEKTLALAQNQGLPLAVKYHPREHLADFLSVSNAEGVLTLPQSLPIELIYIIAAERIRLVIGDVSTSLITAKWLLDSAAVISLAPLIGHSDPQLFKTFGELGIDLVDNVAEIGEYLSNE